MKQRIVFIIAILSNSCVLSAQDISLSNLRWKIDSLLDLRTNEHFAYSCTFETTGQGSIIWNQNGGFTSAMTINSTTGAWTNVQATGTISYSITYEEEPGTMLLERVGSRCRIILTLGQSGQPSLHHEYIVSLVTQIP